MKGRSFSAAIVMLTASLGVTRPSVASVDRGEPDYSYTLSFVISDPQWMEHVDYLLDVLRREGSLDSLGIETTYSDDLSATQGSSVEQSEHLAGAHEAEYTVDSRAYASPEIVPLAPTYDYITPDECKAHPDKAGPAPGWIKNHFAYCQMQLHGHVAVDCWLGPFLCRTVGTFGARSILIGYGKKGERRVEFDFMFDPIVATGVYLGAQLEVEMECDANGGGCQAGSNTSRSAPIAAWIANRDARFEFTSPALPPDPANGEQVVTAAFRPHYEIDARRSAHDRDYRGPEGGVRFDSAWYLTYSEGAIFDRTTPSMAYSLSDEAVKMSARHIHDALNHPESTKPEVANKHIPGGSASDTIRRLYHEQVRRDLNRATSTGVCRTEWPGYPDLGQDCDEFPFASTYEGAARFLYAGTRYGMFSVRPINAPDNQEAGRRLGVWYGEDRILDGDRFFVRILP